MRRLRAGVYVIRCRATEQVYVGSSVDVPHRLAAHRWSLRDGHHANRALQAAWRRHGETSFSFSWVEQVVAVEDLQDAEKRWVRRLGSNMLDRGFNVNTPGRRGPLARLAEEGLVTTSPTRRTFVSSVTLALAREVYPIVVALEALALQLALPHATPAALDEMRAANTRLATALDAGDTCAALDAGRAVHGAIIAMSDNGELQAMLAALISKVQRIERAFWGAADRRASVVDHERLIACMEAGDAASAQAALARNWERGLAWVAAPESQSAETGEIAENAEDSLRTRRIKN